MNNTPEDLCVTKNNEQEETDLSLSDHKKDQSDGYHTFSELYEHRHALYLALMSTVPEISWVSLNHYDGDQLDGWFISGIRLSTGDITYHLPMRLWNRACKTGAKVLPYGIKWDGHTSEDVIQRLINFSLRSKGE